jgi:hypothetical protein
MPDLAQPMSAKLVMRQITHGMAGAREGEPGEARAHLAGIQGILLGGVKVPIQQAFEETRQPARRCHFPRAVWPASLLHSFSI